MQENWRKMKEEKMRQWDIHLILSYTVAALDWTFPTDRQKSSVSLRAPPVLLHLFFITLSCEYCISVLKLIQELAGILDSEG